MCVLSNNEDISMSFKISLCPVSCACVCLSLGMVDIAVLDAQQDVGAGAAAGALLEQTATLQR